MSEPFLSSDDYDERAHQLYNEAQYDEAIETLREGLGLYPHAVELHVGMGYARLAREEYVWARRAFEEAVGLDPEHEDALAGLGEVLLKFGDRAGAIACFDRILALGFRDDHDLMLQVGRALFREGVLDQARRFFEVAITGHPDSAEAAACVGYASHRLADEGGALYWLRRALELDLEHAEARVHLANLLYARGEYEAALLTELQGMKARSGPGDVHRVSMLNGATYVGTWEEIVRQMKDDAAEWARGSLEQYMAAVAHRGRKETGVAIPATDPESFIRGSADAGLLRILH